MKKSTRTILTVAAVIVGGYFLYSLVQAPRLYPAQYQSPYQKRDHVRVF